MRKLLMVFAVFAVLGTAASTASWATAPGKNGQIAFRQYLNTGRTMGAIVTANPDGTNVRRVTRPRTGVEDTRPDWSPNGRKIVFERKLPCPAGGRKDGLDSTCDLLYTVGRSGEGLKQLVPCGFKVSDPFPGTCVGVHTPSWSPDGSKIAFRYTLVDHDYVDSLNVSAGIWIVNADGTDRRQVTQLTPGRFFDRGPQWSPDGTKLVFAREDLKTDADAVFTVSIDGTGIFQVTPWRLGAGDDPDWSPDGKWLLFANVDKNGPSNVYKAHPDGTGLTNLTKQRANGYHYLSSSFSPDGRMIVTARTPGTGPEGAADIVVMNADGSKIRQITKTRLWESGADWGPRG
jgi:Tol biopolymer transport system component